MEAEIGNVKDIKNYYFMINFLCEKIYIIHGSLLIDVFVEHKRENREHCEDCGIPEHQNTVVDRNRNKVEAYNENHLNY